VFVTQHRGVSDPLLIDRLWEHYERCYRRTAEQAPTREMFFRHEFDEVLRDTTNRTWVGWEGNQIIGSAVVATQFAATRYLSRAFFETNYQQQTLDQRVHYLLWVVVDSAWRAKGALARMAREALAVEAAEGALLVFDTPESNQKGDTGGLAEIMSRMAAMVSRGTSVDLVTVQRYFATDFSQGIRYREQFDEGAEAVPA
jgi:hypothetical protein